MKRIVAVAITITCAALGTPAKADTRCAELFEAMGRTYVPDAPPVDSRIPEGDRVRDCPAKQIMQFAYDFAAAKAAKPVVSVDQMAGTWVSDDILGMVVGLFIPVYELLEVTPGSAEGEVSIVQKLLRYGDPAEMYFADNYNMPPVDVVAAGRIATYGNHIAVLASPGQLEPRRVRYHDFPIEGDRYTGLAMKLRMASFLQTRPISVRTDGTRLVFEFFDRMSPGGKRLMSFRRREPDTPDRALKIIILGEVSASHFNCLMEAMERPSEGYLKGLGGVSIDAFHQAIDTAFANAMELRELQAKLRSDRPKSERDALRDRLIELMDKHTALVKDGPLTPLVTAAESGTPFGCPSLY